MKQLKDYQLTSSMEDYLEVIGVVKKTKGVVRVKDIGDLMGVKKPSVNNALKNLSEKGLVVHEHYGYIDFTKEGEKLAAVIQERHDLLFRFLVEVLHVDEDVAAKDACQMEHVISTKTFKKLNQFIQFLDCYSSIPSTWHHHFHLPSPQSRRSSRRFF